MSKLFVGIGAFVLALIVLVISAQKIIITLTILVLWAILCVYRIRHSKSP